MSENQSSAEGDESANKSPELLRVLGPGTAVAMVVGNVVGGGIFFKPADAAKASGDFGLIMTAWLAGGIVCLLGALCFAELAVMMPRAGGIYVYLRETYGRLTAFLFGWSEFVFGRPASIGALASVIVFQLGDIFEYSFGPLEVVVISLILVALLAVVNILGVTWGGNTQAGTTLIKSSFLATFVIVPFVLYLTTGTAIDPQNYSSRVEPANSSLATQFAMVLLAVMWAYNGWHAVTPVAEEIRDPAKNIPRALFGGTVFVTVLYLIANASYHGVLSMSEVADSGQLLPQKMIAAVTESMGGDMSTSFWARAASIGISIMVIVSLFGGINCNMMNAPRVAYAMGRDGTCFPVLGSVHPKFRTPVAAILTQTVMSAVLIVASGILIRTTDLFQQSSIFSILSDYVVFIANIFYSLTVLAVVILRIRQPDRPRPYRVPLFPLFPIVYLAASLWFLVYLCADGKTFVEALAGVVLTILGVPFFYWIQKRYRPADDNASV